MNNLLEINMLPAMAKNAQNAWLKYYKNNKRKLESMDLLVHQLHYKVSKKIDCLSCGNCCRTLGPKITDKDVDRMAKAQRMKSSELTTKYLMIDEDGDLVFQSMPCPFLGADNHCSIYESRPKACREYPHTDRKKFYQIFHLSVTNASTCPIVYEVLERLCTSPAKP